MTVRHLGDLIIYLGAIAAALAAIGALLRYLVVGPLKRWIRDELRAPLEATRSSAAAIETEVSRNSGSSMKDAVVRTEAKVDVLGERFNDHLNRYHER